jgi:molybdopterin biosynthesis enzyme
VITSSNPVSANVCFAAAILAALSSVVTTRPLPLSRTADARCSAEIPNDIPNSTMVAGRVARTNEYSSRPASGVTGM